MLVKEEGGRKMLLKSTLFRLLTHTLSLFIIPTCVANQWRDYRETFCGVVQEMRVQIPLDEMGYNLLPCC